MKGKALKFMARALRRNQTETEKEMWRFLRSRELFGYKFRRQQPFGAYVADFCCLERKLIIELDGSQHAAQRLEDDCRTQFLEQEGFKIIRFWNNEVFENTAGVLEIIRKNLESPSPQPSPLKGEGMFREAMATSSPLKGEGVFREAMGTLSSLRKEEVPRQTRKLCLSIVFFAALACQLSFLPCLDAAAFESNGLGARSMGMGHSFVSISGSYESVFWNPAGIALLANKTFHSEYRDLYGLGLLRYFTVGYVHPGVGRGALGLSWLKLDTVGEASFLDYTENTLIVSYGTKVMGQLYAGINGKYYRVNGTVGAGGQGLDLGVQYTFSSITFGGSVQDVTRTVVSWDSGARDMIPRRLNLGLSRKFFTNTLIASQIGWQNETNLSFRQGIEQQLFNKTVNLRLGAIEQNKDWRFAWGVGIRVKILSIDYAWERLRFLGDSQVFSVTVRF